MDMKHEKAEKPDPCSTRVERKNRQVIMMSYPVKTAAWNVGPDSQKDRAILEGVQNSYIVESEKRSHCHNAARVIPIM